MHNLLGIYEKALPKTLGWRERLLAARDAGYDFVEMSVDETPERLARLDWTAAERLDFVRATRDEGVAVPSMCLSAHRRCPFGSADPRLRAQAGEVMRKAIELARELGIRVIQLAGYDVYYEPSSSDTRARYLQGMQRALELAARHQVMLAMEIMDTTFMNSIGKFLALKAQLPPSPWFGVYPDLGNLSAWGNDVEAELAAGAGHIVGVHVKESRAVGPGFAGAFRDVPFGEGNVDFVRCFRTLHRLGYAGPFLIEMWTETAADPLREVRRAREWVRERMAAGGYELTGAGSSGANTQPAAGADAAARAARPDNPGVAR
jgi:hexulose-6-phosphate isomerase